MEEAVKEEKEEIIEEISDEGFAVLENGMRIAVKRNRDLPLVSVSLVMPGGLRAETRKVSGLSRLTASMMMKGTKRRDEEDIIPAVEMMGGNIGAFSGVNSMGINMKLMSKDLDGGLNIFEDVIKNSIFPTEELDKQKRKVIAAIGEQEMSVFDMALLAFRSFLYGDHPYSMRILGEIDTVKWITREEVVDFYTEYWGPGNAVMTVVGDVDLEETLDGIVKRFEDWEGTSRLKPKAFLLRKSPGKRIYRCRRNNPWSFLVFWESK